MTDKSEERARWRQPRPDYMREAEPMAHPAAWPSLDPIIHVDPEEQLTTRKIFLEGKRQGKSVKGIREHRNEHDQKKKAG